MSPIGGPTTRVSNHGCAGADDPTVSNSYSMTRWSGIGAVAQPTDAVPADRHIEGPDRREAAPELPNSRRREAAVLACVLGSTVALSGFAPLNSAADRLSVDDQAFLVVLMPPVIVALVAVACAIRHPGHITLPWKPAWATCAGLLMLGGALSLLSTDDLERSVGLLVFGIVAPLVFTASVMASTLPRTYLAASFVAATALLMLRADIVLLGDYGWPSAEDLFQAKFANAPYDFHYYALGNPNQTAAFLMIPLALAVFWQTDRRQAHGWRRAAIVVVGASIAVSLLFVYSRIEIVGAVLLILAALIVTPTTVRRRTLTGLGVIAVVSMYFLSRSGRNYLGALTVNDSDASQVVRADSVTDGINALADNLITGQGIGEYGVTHGTVPVHSAVLQQAVETGLLGGVAVAGITVLALALVIHVGRAVRWRGLQFAGAAAAAVYCITAAGSLGLFLHNDTTAIWGLALGIALAIATDAMPSRRARWHDARPAEQPR